MELPLKLTSDLQIIVLNSCASRGKPFPSLGLGSQPSDGWSGLGEVNGYGDGGGEGQPRLLIPAAFPPDGGGLLAQVGLASVAVGASTCSGVRDGEHSACAHSPIPGVIAKPTMIAAKDGEALYSQQKQDQELTVAQIMNYLLPNSDLKSRENH